MSCIHRLCTQILVLTIAIVVGNLAFSNAASGQSALAKVPNDCSAYASIPLPPEAADIPAPKTFPACASYRFYQGIGRPVNYSRARACAWRERRAQKAELGQNSEQPTAWVVGGSLILADIYVNGAGVRRNIPLAMRFACEAEQGMAMLALPDVEKLNASSRKHGPFEFCDYAATTFTMDFCSGYTSEIEGDRKNRFYDRLKSSMSPAQRAAFERLLAAHNAYIKAHALEVYQGGTIRAIRTMGSQNILNELFHTDLVHFERKKWPVLSANQIAIADRLVQREYEKKLQELQAPSKEPVDEDAVTAGDLSKVEKSWETYRNAWAEFAQLRYPSVAAKIRAEISLARYRLLKTIG